MKSSPATDLRRKIAGICLIAAPALMLAGDALNIGADMTYAWLVMSKLAFALFVPALLALVHLLRERADRTGMLGGGLAVVGCLAASGILTASMIGWSIETAKLDGQMMSGIEEAMRKNGVAPYVFMYPLPGLGFPVGLLILSYGLLRTRVAPWVVVVMLALGAILFPVGRIGGVAAAVLGSGVALSAALGLIGWRVLNWTAAEWEHVPVARAETLTLEGEALTG